MALNKLIEGAYFRPLNVKEKSSDGGIRQNRDLSYYNSIDDKFDFHYKKFIELLDSIR